MPNKDDNTPLSVATAKLTRMMGEARGLEILSKTLADGAMPTITSADDLMRFADMLASREQGLLKMIGHSLRSEALLRGAQLKK